MLALPLYLNTISYPQESKAFLWVWYYPDAQTEGRSWLTELYLKPLIKRSNLQSSMVIWRSHQPLRHVTTHSTSLSHEPSQSGCSVHPSSKDVTDRKITRFVSRPRLVLSPDLAISPTLIIKDQSNRWTALSIYLRHPMLVKTATRRPHVRHSQQRLFENHGYPRSFWEAFKASDHLADPKNSPKAIRRLWKAHDTLTPHVLWVR